MLPGSTQGPYLGPEREALVLDTFLQEYAGAHVDTNQRQERSHKSGRVQSGFLRIQCTSAMEEDVKEQDRGAGMKRGGWASIKRPSSILTLTLTMTSVSSGAIP